MSIAIRISKKSRRVIAEIKRHDQYFRSGIRKALHEIGKEVVKEDRRLITVGPKTGRVYLIKGRFHQASAPGEAPANLTGRLKNSASYVVHSEYKMEVGESAPYAKFLEDGTSKMDPRPHLIKAVENTSRTAENALRDYVAEDIGL